MNLSAPKSSALPPPARLPPPSETRDEAEDKRVRDAFLKAWQKFYFIRQEAIRGSYWFGRYRNIGGCKNKTDLSGTAWPQNVEALKDEAKVGTLDDGNCISAADVNWMMTTHARADKQYGPMRTKVVDRNTDVEKLLIGFMWALNPAPGASENRYEWPPPDHMTPPIDDKDQLEGGWPSIFDLAYGKEYAQKWYNVHKTARYLPYKEKKAEDLPYMQSQIVDPSKPTSVEEWARERRRVFLRMLKLGMTRIEPEHIHDVVLPIRDSTLMPPIGPIRGEVKDPCTPSTYGGIEMLGEEATQEQLSNALVGDTTLRKLHDMMMKKEAVISCANAKGINIFVPLESKDANNSAYSIVRRCERVVVRYRTPLGGGSFNTVLRVNNFHIGASFFNMFDNKKIPELVFRTSRDDLPERDAPTGFMAVQEIVISSYAAYRGIGPQIYAAYIAPHNPKYCEFNDRVVGPCVFMQKMKNNIVDVLQWRGFTREEFADALIDLLRRSTDAGFWHLDAKPPNMLYERVGADKKLKFYWADFDGSFCRIWSKSFHAGKENLGKCSIVVHAALVMGYISCIVGVSTFDYYRSMVAEKLEQAFNISELRTEDYLTWIDKAEVAERHKSEVNYEMETKWLIAKRFRKSMNHYLTDKKGIRGYRCIILNDGKPTLLQFFDFAVNGAKGEIGEIESLRNRQPDSRRLGR